MPVERSGAVAPDLEPIEDFVSRSAKALEGPADSWLFKPVAEFEAQVEPYVYQTTGELRLCLMFLGLLIRDVMTNLSGDVPYDAIGQDLDVARANVQRGLRLILTDLASDLKNGQGFDKTTGSCATVVGEYLTTISRINEKGGF